MLYNYKLIANIKNNNRFLLVRHGESIWNKDSKFTGWTNIPLTNNGKNEAIRMAKELIKNNLCPNIIFTSVLDRAINTSNLIRDEINKNIPIHTSWRLNERHYGSLEGIPRQYIRNIFGDETTLKIRCNFHIKPPLINNNDNNNNYKVYKNCYFEKIKYGESKKNVLQRALPYYENDILYTLSENKFPLIVTHKHTARVLMKHLLKIDDENFENFDLPSKKILLVYLNDNLSYKEHFEINY